jgi:hypothetical protein
MGDSNTRYDTTLPPTPSGTGTGVAPVPAVPGEQAPDAVTDTGTVTVAPVPKRRHVRGATGRKPGPPKTPLTVEQKEQATVMCAAGHSSNKIAQATGRNRAAIKRYLDTPEAIAEVQDERAELVDIYRDRARACVVAIDDEKIQKASALQLATSSGILLDKSLLLSGKPTQNVAIIVEVLDVIRQRRDAEEERQHQQAKALLSLPANQT